MEEKLEVYLVGGAVRDQLLGRPVKERDWVVVGATPKQMLALDFQQVGKDFPVFLHPETKEEYALARTERKTGHGYKGFEFNADAAVTLEEDLLRRDLTINAIAEKPTGELVDPYGGVKDIHEKTLRHVSDAFVEDPVRLLRVARFAAQLEGFTVAFETNGLLNSMVESGEVDHLVPERVWKELHKALQAKYPERFFEVLEDAGALSHLFPEWGDFKLVNESSDSLIRFVLLCSHLNDADVLTLCQRYRIPKLYQEIALLVSRFKALYHEETNAENLLKVISMTDALRRPERLDYFLEVCFLIYHEDKRSLYQAALEKVQAINVQEIIDQCDNPAEIPEKIREARLRVLS